MITKAELEKIVEDGAEYYATNEGATIEKREAFTVDKHLGNPQQYEYVNRYNNDSFCAFKSGAAFVTGILMLEIERLNSKLVVYESPALPENEQPETALEHYRFNKGHKSNKIYEENTYLNKKLSEANESIAPLKEQIQFMDKLLCGNKKELDTQDATIQSLKDENGRMRDALNEIKFYNGDSSRVEMIILKALTQKAEE